MCFGSSKSSAALTCNSPVYLRALASLHSRLQDRNLEVQLICCARHSPLEQQITFLNFYIVYSRGRASIDVCSLPIQAQQSQRHLHSSHPAQSAALLLPSGPALLYNFPRSLYHAHSSLKHCEFGQHCNAFHNYYSGDSGSAAWLRHSQHASAGDQFLGRT